MFPRVLASLASEVADLDELAFVRKYPDAWLIWENRLGERSTLPQFTMAMGGDGGGKPRNEFEPAAYRLLGAIKELTIGRNGDGILINDSTVSDKHLVLQQVPGGGWTVSDAGSKNGTKVDGQQLAPETPHPLKSGAQIQIGAVKLTFLSAASLFKRVTAV
ncbi:MAG TPA: FHA domain-containing protein [Myxococcaceae bacterium]|nr:FHA domain-containing protein [Myxococcaceae bacterium]